MMLFALIAAIVCCNLITAQGDLNTAEFCNSCKDRRNPKDLYQHPSNCRAFVRCTFATDGSIAGQVKLCQSGTFFNEAILQCTEDVNGDCTDICISDDAPECYVRGGSDQCQYRRCSGRRTVDHCCAPGTIFKLDACECELAPAGFTLCPCQATLNPEPLTKEPPTADVAAGSCTNSNGETLRVAPGNTFSFYYVISQPGETAVLINMPCPPGTSFHLVSTTGEPICKCENQLANEVPNLTAQKGSSCILHLPFNQITQFFDISVYGRLVDNNQQNPVTIIPDGAGGSSGAAEFNGENFLEIAGLKTFDFQNGLSMCFFARCEGGACSSGGILSNAAASTGGDWSIRTAVAPDNALTAEIAVLNPARQSTLTTAVVDVTNFFHVCEIYGDGQWTLFLNGNQVAQNALEGPVAIKHCPFVIGGDQRFGNFKGVIDEVMICDHSLGTSGRNMHQNMDYDGMAAVNMIPYCPDGTTVCYR